MSTSAERTNVDDVSPSAVGELEEPIRERLAELPASASIAYLVLRQADEPLSSSEVADTILRSRSTLHRSVKELRDANLVDERPPLQVSRARSIWSPVDVDDVEAET